MKFVGQSKRRTMNTRTLILVGVFSSLLIGSGAALSAPVTSSGGDSSCTEPFCTYAPPKLTGDGMADAAIKIMNSGTISSGGSDEREKQIHAFVADFRAKKNFRFLSPYLVAETKEDKRLKEILSPECISKITKNPDSNTVLLNADSSGPFYLFSVPVGKSSVRDALFVYGFKSNPYKGHTIGRFIVFDDKNTCEIRSEFPIYGNDARENPKITYPLLAGVGYRTGIPFFYYLSVEGAYNFTYMNYLLRYSRIDAPKGQKDNITSFYNFAESFNPKSIIENEEHLP